MKKLLPYIFITFIIIPVNLVFSAPFQNGSFEEDSSLYQNDHSISSNRNYDVLNENEQDLTGWNIEILSGVMVTWAKFNYIDDNPYDGTYYFIPCGSSSRGRISQVFDTSVGFEYNISLWARMYRTGSNSNNRTIRFEVKEDNASGNSILLNHDIVTDDTISWTEYSFNFIANTNQTYLSLENITSSNTTGCAYLDKITLTQLTVPPILSVMNKVYVDDPVGENLKAIPGNIMAFQREVQNTGGEIDNNSFNMTFNLDSNMAFQLNSVSLNDGQSIGSLSGDTVNDYNSINPSGLTLGTITYSDNGGSSFTYTPSANITDPITGNQYDDRITNIKISTNGSFADGTSSSTGLRIYYKALIK